MKKVDQKYINTLNLKQVEGYENYYVSSNGEVFCKKVTKTKTYFTQLSKSLDSNKRYYIVDLCKNGIRKHFLLHRLVAFHFCQGYFEGAVVNHIDGDCKNNDYINLEWCTQKHNVNEGYKTSNVDQTRNYKMYILFSPNGEKVGEFKAFSKVREFVKENDLDTALDSLKKYGKSKGYYIEKYDK